MYDKDKYYNNIKIIDNNKYYNTYKDDKIFYYGSNYSLKNYGNSIDSLLSTLTQSELVRLRKLLIFLNTTPSNTALDYLLSLDYRTMLVLVYLVTDSTWSYIIDQILSLSSTEPRLDEIRIELMKYINNKNLSPDRIINALKQGINNTSISRIPTPRDIKTPDVVDIADSGTKEEKRKNPVIEKYMSDILGKEKNPNFRGWMLPNGELLSQYNDTTSRQDHSKLVRIFMDGTKKYDPNLYEKLQALYTDYRRMNNVGNDAILDESFAVEVLGWIQISHFGRRRLIYRAERYQDVLVRPFLVDYGFDYIVMDRGRSYELEFAALYEHINEIMELGLEEKYDLAV